MVQSDKDKSSSYFNGLVK